MQTPFCITFSHFRWKPARLFTSVELKSQYSFSCDMWLLMDERTVISRMQFMSWRCQKINFCWLGWLEESHFWKRIGTNWVISLQFFCCASDCRELSFLANCQFLLPWLKILQLNALLKEATAGNDWVVKCEQCVEGNRVMFEEQDVSHQWGKSNVNSAIKNFLTWEQV